MPRAPGVSNLMVIVYGGGLGGAASGAGAGVEVLAAHWRSPQS
jgi:hypothetical protein